MLFSRSPISDADLVRAVLHSRTRQFGVLVQRYQGLVYSTILARVSRIEEVEDLAQETFLRAFRQLDSLQDPRAFRGWLKQIADHLAVNFLRSRKLQQSSADSLVPLPTADTPEQLFERQETQARVWSAISQLAEEQREVILLYYYQDRCSVEQLAEWLELPPSTVRGRLERARQELRGILESFDTQVEQALAPHQPDKRFTKKIMSVLPAVPWNLKYPPYALGQMGWALGTVLTGVVGFMVFGLAQGWWPERKEPAMTVQWVRGQEGDSELDRSAADQQNGLVEWVSGTEGSADQPSLFGGEGLSAEAQALQDQALQHGWGGRLAWEFEEGTEGWIAREGNYSHRPPDLLPTRASNGVLHIDLGPYQPGRVPVVELISPEIGYESQLFERAEIRVRVVHPAPVRGGFDLAWTNPFNRLFPGQDPYGWERQTEEELKAADEWARQGKGHTNQFQIMSRSPLTFSSAWQDLAVERLGEREGVRWEGALGDLRFTFRLGDISRPLEQAELEQLPQALEVERIVLSRSRAALQRDLVVPREELPVPAGTWLGEGQFSGLDQTGLEWPILGDLDGDGDLDLVVSYQVFDARYNAQQGIVPAFNDGQGCFVLGPKQVLEYRQDGTSSIVRLDGADLNQDGLLDLVVGQGLHTRIFLDQGQGVFWEDRFLENQYYVGRGDVDGDGDVDVVTSPYQPGTHDLPQAEQHYPVRLYLNYGQGVLVDREVEIPAEGGWFPYALDDFDGDGRAELVWWWSAEKGLDSRVLIWDGYAGGKWLQQSLISFLGLAEARKYYVPPRLVCLGDLRADGAWELGVPLETYADISLYTAGVEVASPAAGVVPWLPRQVRFRQNMTHQPYLIPQVWDLNGDGVFDPLFLDGEYRAGPHLRVLRGQKGQLPVEEGLYPLPAPPHGWAAGDVDGDRDVDVVVVVEGIDGAGVYVLRNVLGERVAERNAGIAQE